MWNKFFNITKIETNLEYNLLTIKLNCKKRLFVEVELFYQFAKNLAQKTVDEHGQGSYHASWATADCKNIELNIYLPIQSTIDMNAINCFK